MADAPRDVQEGDGAPPLGAVLEGRYRLSSRLGEGGVGWVYRAEHLKLGTEVAIKMLQAPYEQHEMLRPRFEREAKALAALRHPHIVTLTDYSIAEDGRPYLVMELLEGQTLAELIAAGPIPEARARRILGSILDALIYAHGKGFAHRDLKPTNVFLVELPTDPDHVKILDFGFVKLLGGDDAARPALTRSGIAFGTPSYMCPEQATGAPTDPRADLYSAGVVLFEMLAGRRPYVGEIPEVIRQHLTAPVPPLDVGGAPIVAGPELAELLEAALAKDPSDRFQTAHEMRAALDALPTPALHEKCSVDPRGDTIPAPERTEPYEQATTTRPTTPPPNAVAGTAHTAVARVASASRIVPGSWRLALIAVVVFVVGGSGAAWLMIGRSAEGGASPVPGGTRSATYAPDVAPPDVATPDVATPAIADPAIADPAIADPAIADMDLTGDVPLGASDGQPTDLEAEYGDADPDAIVGEGALLGEEVEPASVSGPGEEPRDPWSSREPVPLMEAARRRLDRGRPLFPAGERLMRRYVREHRDDPRAHLILARHFLARGYDISALQRYSLAYRVDSGARLDPNMLTDLVRLARQPVVHRDVADLLVRAYGAGALPAIERALSEEGRSAVERQRLREVRDRLLQASRSESD